MFLTALCDLRTNANMQVCNDDEPIPGLYNLGTMVGDFFSGYYTFLVDGHNYGACCLTFGYLTGKYIAEKELATSRMATQAMYLWSLMTV